MVLTEFNEEVFVKGIKQEEREEGIRKMILLLAELGKDYEETICILSEKYDLDYDAAKVYVEECWNAK